MEEGLKRTARSLWDPYRISPDNLAGLAPVSSLDNLKAFSFRTPSEQDPNYSQPDMRVFLPIALLLSAVLGVAKMPLAKYHDLPSFREQDALEKGWVQKRYDLVPGILEKQSVATPPQLIMLLDRFRTDSTQRCRCLDRDDAGIRRRHGVPLPRVQHDHLLSPTSDAVSVPHE